MDTSQTGLWVTFFTAAGIPSDVGATYAITFTENRIQNDMLLDLNKEYLRDMGITRMGDVIAILRHAKLVHENTARERVLNTTAPKIPIATVAGRLTTTQLKASSPASRMLEHYTRNPPLADPPQMSSKVSIKRRVDTSVNTDTAKKVRHIEVKPNDTARPVAVSASKQTVFSRLGGTTDALKTENTSNLADSRTVFSRLGNKSLTVNVGDSQRSVKEEENDEPLKYEGILKSPPEIKKTIVNRVKPPLIRKIVSAGTMHADQAPVSVKDKLAIPKTKSVKFSNHVDYKVIEPNPPQKRVIIEGPKPIPIKLDDNPVFNKPERRLMIPAASGTSIGVKTRLGSKTESQQIQRNVFNRLGGGKM